MRTSPSIALGAASGAITVLVFTALHDLLITDIWDMIGPMVFSGAVCGACLVWSYRATRTDHTPQRWWTYIGICSGLLVALGPLSVLTLDSRWTIAEMSNNEDAMALLMPPAIPLMAVAAVVGTAVLWLWLGRRPHALLPLLLTQVLLVFFAGHQLAFLGLIETGSHTVVALAEFGGLILLLGALFGTGVLTGEALRSRQSRTGAGRAAR